MRYSATRETVAGVELAVLRDAETQSEVRVAPSLGNTCVAYRVGDWRVLDEPPTERDLRERASSYGIPILFPWPNRLRDARFTWDGREYRVPPSPGMPHANHGLVRNRPWKRVLLEARDSSGPPAGARGESGLADQPRIAPLTRNGGAAVQSEIRSTDFPELAEQYPSAFSLVVTYSLRASGLMVDAHVTNVGDAPLPFGYGLHPYFSIPFGPSGRRETCTIWVPATQAWELVDNLPTGARVPVGGRTALRFRQLGDDVYDDLFTGLTHEAAPGVAGGSYINYRLVLADDPSGRQIVVEDDTSFREAVVFAPPNRAVVALEPYTCATDALNLTVRGVDAGLRVLQPGEVWQGRVHLGQRRGIAAASRPGTSR